MMTIQDLGSIGELIAAIATVLTLVYLAAQIRQNTQTVRSSTLHQNTDLWSAFWVRLAEPDMARAYAQAMTGQPDIAPLAYTQFFLICRGLFLALENQYYQVRHGVLDGEAYASYERAIAEQLLAYRGFRIWWEQSRSVFSPSFAAHIDDLIESEPEADPTKLYAEWQRIAKSKAEPSFLATTESSRTEAPPKTQI
jgi:hypothetical protein